MPASVPPPARDRATRQADARALLATPEIDVWVATASAAGVPHLVPVSLAWVGERVVIAVEGGSLTARNLTASGVARLGVGPTRDVVMVDAILDRSVPVDEDPALGEAYAGQADWDPRGLAGYVFLVLRPERIQAWRESNEIAGRTILRAGAWLS
ncbi:pyridoxamine 5'-phosphate oxidase family protein [Nocardioides sp. BYT-33-1]|uniref:pyridoxamine 5'-phosphate oxidase family protein n=1 Tax=Nocardioides sp. BYT-33-1 TaxID=3416952 RepID=UPI003F533D35